MRILIVSDNVSARFGGEAILPLHYFRRLRARGIEAWLISHSRTAGELSELMPDQQDRIHYIPNLWIHKVLSKTSRRLPERVNLRVINIILSQYMQRKIARRLIKKTQD